MLLELGVGGQSHSSAIYRRGKKCSVTIVYEAGWSLESFRTDAKNSCLHWDSNPLPSDPYQIF